MALVTGFTGELILAKKTVGQYQTVAYSSESLEDITANLDNGSVAEGLKLRWGVALWTGSIDYLARPAGWTDTQASVLVFGAVERTGALTGMYRFKASIVGLGEDDGEVDVGDFTVTLDGVDYVMLGSNQVTSGGFFYPVPTDGSPIYGPSLLNVSFDAAIGSESSIKALHNAIFN